MKSSIMSKIIIGMGIFLVIAITALSFGVVGYNRDENYQILQSLKGNMTGRVNGGVFMKWLAKETTYPKSVQTYYRLEKDGKEDDRVGVTFNDGGTADISTMVRFRMPIDLTHQLLIHREFTANIENVEGAVRSHLLNCLKVSATMMSASENQASRKAEFQRVVEEQLSSGLYRFKRVEIPVLDMDGKKKLDENGMSVTVMATEIIRDSYGNPIIDTVSPIKQYGIEITQVSIEDIDYDKSTRDQFAKKKESSLKAELSKIDVEKARQETLQAQEEGKKRSAEMEAEMNVKVVEAEGKGRMVVAKATQEKLEAQQIKERDEIDANRKLEIAKTKLKETEVSAQATVIAAEARQKEILLAGNITERERVLAELWMKRDGLVYDAMAKYKGPQTVIMTGGAQGQPGSSNMMEALGLNALMELKDRMGGTIPVPEIKTAPAPVTK